MQPPPEKSQDTWTLLTLLQWTAEYFKRREIDAPRITAEILIAKALSMERIDLYTQFDRPMAAEELARIKAMIKRRVSREPTAYITGEKEFWSLPIAVTPDVLIPRPETECLVEEGLAVLDAAQDDDEKSGLVLDLGCGSGAVSIAMAGERSHCRYIATDLSLAALAVARRNAVENHVSDRIHFIAGDWTDPFSLSAKFTLILSNPPYVNAGDIPDLQPEVSRYEPRLALDGGKDGLTCLRRIVAEASGFLEPGGWLLLEIGWDQAAAVERIARESGRYSEVHFRKDYSGLDRVAKLRVAS